MVCTVHDVYSNVDGTVGAKLQTTSIVNFPVVGVGTPRPGVVGRCASILGIAF